MYSISQARSLYPFNDNIEDTRYNLIFQLSIIDVTNKYLLSVY